MRLLGIVMLLAFSASSAADVAGKVQIEEPFARSALQQQANSAIFMRINNQGNAAALVSAESSAARVVELHTHQKDQNGMMRMRKIKQIELPSGERTSLQPGGLHIMLIGLQRDLNIGDDVDVTLVFSDGSENTLQVPIVKVMRPQGMKHKQGHNMKIAH